MNTNDKNNNQPADQTEEVAGMEINTDENMAGTEMLNEPVTDENEVEKLKAQIDELKDRNLRLAAEFDNFRRRTAKERLETIQTAGRSVIESLLDVLDDCDRAQDQMNKTDDVAQIKEGVTLVFSKLRNTLSSKGLKPLESLQQDFDVDLHEAITEMESGEDQKGKVVAEVQKGYYLNDKIIRHAKVVVGK